MFGEKQKTNQWNWCVYEFKMEYIRKNSCDIGERDHPKESETEKKQMEKQGNHRLNKKKMTSNKAKRWYRE